MTSSLLKITWPAVEFDATFFIVFFSYFEDTNQIRSFAASGVSQADEHALFTVVEGGRTP